MVPIDRPVFIIGTGRCGSSLLLELLGHHPDLAWFSHWSSYLPGDGWWAALERLHDVPWLSAQLARSPSRLVPRPTENYRLLNAATDHVFTRPAPLTEADVTEDARRRLRAVVARHLAASGRPRFVMKHTGFPRVRYLRAIFPDARFVHVVRDGRAVAASLCAVDWWSGEGHWGWGALTPAQARAYADSGYHELALAALYWQVLMGHLRAARDHAPPGQLLEVRYDHLVADPVGTVRRITDFAGLSFPGPFEAAIAGTAMTSDDTRWRKTLTPDEQALVTDLLRDDLRADGFDVGGAP